MQNIRVIVCLIKKHFKEVTETQNINKKIQKNVENKKMGGKMAVNIKIKQ